MRVLLCILLAVVFQGVSLRDVTLTEVSAPASSGSLNFDESDDYVEITDHTSFTLAGNSDRTFMVWMKVNSTTNGYTKYFTSTGAWGGSGQYNGAYENDDDLVSRLSDGTEICYMETDAGGSLEDAWYLVALVIDDSETDCSVYACASGSCVQRTNDSSCDLTASMDPADWEWGRRADANADRYFVGQLAYGSFHSKAYTTAELEALSNGTQSNFESEADDASTLFFLNDEMDTDLCSTCCGGSGCTVTQYGSPTTNTDGPFD